ncbi:MAG: V-type ATP synthase subunit F [Candidatus Hodarchaeota archaeon]
MEVQKIHIIGEDEIVILLGLLGIEGTVVRNEEEFLQKFLDLIKIESIGILLVSIPLRDDIIDFLLDFKKANKKPFVFILPDIFETNIEKGDIIFNKIQDALGDIVFKNELS